jgi:oxygen-independent coproporphyrinogen-3 oxidase
MIVKYQAPGPWWHRGVNLLKLLPGAVVKARASTWDLAVQVEERGSALYISVIGRDISEQGIVPAQRKAFLHILFRLLSQAHNAPLSPWGVMTGVRPGKIAARLMEELGPEQTAVALGQDWLVSPEKASLLVRSLTNGYPQLAERGLCLYISVPFCPSRCHYCSFPALSLAQWQKLLPRYIQQAAAELSGLLTACRQYGYPINSIYVGGGTPTSLSPEMLAELLAPAARPGCEFTVEGGRPDTLTPEHIQVLEALGVNRICINAQYPQRETLEAIGRRHTVADFYRALALASSSKISIINSDLIIGLPGQTPGGFVQALENLAEAGAQNISIHALALKRGAQIRKQYLEPAAAQAIAASAYSWLEAQGFLPYYLYRQKDIASNLENVGFGKPGTFCYYNIASIGETEPVLGVGAGAVSKLVRHGAIETLNNPRDPNQYLARSETLVRRKLDWLRR